MPSFTLNISTRELLTVGCTFSKLSPWLGPFWWHGPPWIWNSVVQAGNLAPYASICCPEMQLHVWSYSYGCMSMYVFCLWFSTQNQILCESILVTTSFSICLLEQMRTKVFVNGQMEQMDWKQTWQGWWARPHSGEHGSIDGSPSLDVFLIQFNGRTYELMYWCSQQSLNGFRCLLFKQWPACWNNTHFTSSHDVFALLSGFASRRWQGRNCCNVAQMWKWWKSVPHVPTQDGRTSKKGIKAKTSNSEKSQILKTAMNASTFNPEKAQPSNKISISRAEEAKPAQEMYVAVVQCTFGIKNR